MPTVRQALGEPSTLAASVTVAHAAVQILFKAAKANLPARPDGSHSNLIWSQGMFMTNPLTEVGKTCQIGLSLWPLCLIVLIGGARFEQTNLEGKTVDEAENWLDTQLLALGLNPIGPVQVTYDLPEQVTALERFDADESGLAALAAWYTLATVSLSQLASELDDIEPGPSPVRCWPHHFDIATYISLEEGDAETARGIGVGLSPGDGSYGEPYFYVNPWPHLDAANLPPVPEPGHWHTSGFVGAIATGTAILTLNDLDQGTMSFLRQSVAIGRKQLGL